MHNKPNTKALDSKTITGKIIDEIIRKIPAQYIKTNLCNIDYLPKDKKIIKSCNSKWYRKYKPKNNTIIVLLDKWVQKNFSITDAKIIELAHPASIFGFKNKVKYIRDAIRKIIIYF